MDFSECIKTALLQQTARMAKWNRATLRVLHDCDLLAATELGAVMKMTVEQECQTAVTGARHERTRWLANTDSLGMFETDTQRQSQQDFHSTAKWICAQTGCQP